MSYDIPSAHEETYRGHQITIEYDTDNQCPFDDWDCEPPIVVYSDRSITEHPQYGNMNSPPTLTKKQILANESELLSMITFKKRDTADEINDQLYLFVDDQNDSDRLDILCDLYNMAGQAALVSTVRGCCQGDWSKVLAVATPEFKKACGNEEGYWDDPEKLKPSIQLYGDWAFGNVFGYVIDDGEESCFGFYPDHEDLHDHEYCLREARSVVDSMVERSRKEHWSQIKKWIRSKVAYIYRTPFTGSTI